MQQSSGLLLCIDKQRVKRERQEQTTCKAPRFAVQWDLTLAKLLKSWLKVAGAPPAKELLNYRAISSPHMVLRETIAAARLANEWLASTEIQAKSLSELTMLHLSSLKAEARREED